MELCPTCNRPIPGEHDGSHGSGPKRTRWSISVPPGEEGVLDDLFAQWYEMFQPRWEQFDMPEMGGRGWKYVGQHNLLYSNITAPADVIDRLLPAEIGA